MSKIKQRKKKEKPADGLRKEERKDCFITAEYINGKAEGKTTIEFKSDNSYAICEMKRGKLHGEYSLFK